MPWYKNCVSSGNHSGFNVGSMKFNSGAEIHYAPRAGSLQKVEGAIIERFSKEIDAVGKMTFGNYITKYSTGQSRYLTSSDTLVFNAGIHLSLAKTEEQLLKPLATFMDKLHQEPNRPKDIHVTTPTQHFSTIDGQFNNKKKGLGECRVEVERNPRADVERRMLTGHVDYILDYADLHLGNLHIGSDDCSHYCMPGPPDVVAARLMQIIQQGVKKEP